VFVELGEIVNVVGLKGELKLLISGNFDDRILRSRFLKLERKDGEIESVVYRKHRPKGGTLVVKLAEVDDRDAAERMIGGRLGFLAADYEDPEFPRGETLAAFVYLGCKVVTTAGEEIGRVEDVLTLPANWVLQVFADDGSASEREILIPVIDDVIREVDREAGRVVIEPLPGLLDPARES
jgi:16S rRNA processing protein RimM